MTTKLEVATPLLAVDLDGTVRHGKAELGRFVNGPDDVVVFPEAVDGFSNVSAKCDGPNRVYVVYHGDSKYGTVAVAPNDPRCQDAR